MTVEDAMRLWAEERARIRATPCSNCAHPFYLHHDRCEHPIWPKPGTKPCQCRKFVDPSDVLLP